MDKRKKASVIAIVVVCVILITGYVVNATLLDNPGNAVSTALAGYSAKRYVEKHHPDEYYQIGAAEYDDKNEHYHVALSSSTSADSSFSLEYDHIGRLVRDTYETRVSKRGNTASRLSSEYGSAVAEALATVACPGELSNVGSLSWMSADGPHDRAHHIISDELDLDGSYDLAELGAKAGHIWAKVTVDASEKVTVQTMAQTLLTIRAALDQAGLPFYDIDLYLSYPNGTYSKHMDLDGFLYEDITEKNLQPRIAEALEQAV